jgi:hypothetical protein
VGEHTASDGSTVHPIVAGALTSRAGGAHHTDGSGAAGADGESGLGWPAPPRPEGGGLGWPRTRPTPPGGPGSRSDAVAGGGCSG